jgi:hypothetical protein
MRPAASGDAREHDDGRPRPGSSPWPKDLGFDAADRRVLRADAPGDQAGAAPDDAPVVRTGERKRDAELRDGLGEQRVSGHRCGE